MVRRIRQTLLYHACALWRMRDMASAAPPSLCPAIAGEGFLASNCFNCYPAYTGIYILLHPTVREAPAGFSPLVILPTIQVTSSRGGLYFRGGGGV